MMSICDTCNTFTQWVECPTGGWWSHVDHPEDGHDANPGWQPQEEIDDDGHWFTLSPFKD